ncbi:MAG: tetratricopeptide repeat protein [Planctomycetaceae bacterium]|nr:tetratricopeptide repeat protein [Planctomycetaceae bacterium]
MTKSIVTSLVVAASVLCWLTCGPSLRAEPIAGADSSESASASTEQSQELNDAVARFKERDVPGTLRRLKDAVKKDPNLPPAHVILAQLFAQVNSAPDVRTALEQAVNESPNDPEAYVLMGDIALRDRRITEAMMLYQKADSLMPGFTSSTKRKDILQPRVLSGLAAVDEAREKWSEARKRLEAWLKLDPKSSQAMQRLARCLFQQKDAAGALEKLKDAAKVDSNLLTPEAILAQLYEQAGDRENAKKWMAKALAAAPKDHNTHFVAGQWALETSQFDEAQKQAAEALQCDPKSLRAKVLCGIVALFQKDYPAAERYFEAAHLQAPREFAPSNDLALALIEQKDDAKKNRALQYAESNVQQYQQSPRAAEAAATYGWVLYKLGRLDDAERALNAAVSGGSSNTDTAYYLARVAVERGRDSQAKQLLESALKNNAPFSMRPEAEKLLEQLKK